MELATHFFLHEGSLRQLGGRFLVPMLPVLIRSHQEEIETHGFSEAICSVISKVPFQSSTWSRDGQPLKCGWEARKTFRRKTPLKLDGSLKTSSPYLLFPWVYTEPPTPCQKQYFFHDCFSIRRCIGSYFPHSASALSIFREELAA